MNRIRLMESNGSFGFLGAVRNLPRKLTRLGTRYLGVLFLLHLSLRVALVATALSGLFLMLSCPSEAPGSMASKLHGRSLGLAPFLVIYLPLEILSFFLCRSIEGSPSSKKLLAGARRLTRLPKSSIDCAWRSLATPILDATQTLGEAYSVRHHIYSNEEILEIEVSMYSDGLKRLFSRQVVLIHINPTAVEVLLRGRKLAATRDQMDLIEDLLRVIVEELNHPTQHLLERARAK